MKCMNVGSAFLNRLSPVQGKHGPMNYEYIGSKGMYEDSQVWVYHTRT